MLLQIHEPGQTPLPHENDEDIAVGIDLGTTNSLVAIAHDSQPEILRDELGNAMHPSIVKYLENGTIITGHAADSAEGNVIRSIKRLMGRGAKDLKKTSGVLPYELIEGDGMVRLNVNGKHLTPVEISAEILKSLKKIAEKDLGKPVKRAVITVPAYFDDTARVATKDAAKLAGLEVLRLINEPTAAALAYGLDKGAEGTYAIFDLGGGTFDITILKMEKGVFQVLSTGGSTAIGGDDFDREIAEIFLWEYKMRSGNAKNIAPQQLRNILSVSRKAKEHLTDNNEFTLGDLQLSSSPTLDSSKSPSSGFLERIFERGSGAKMTEPLITLEKFEQAAMPYANACLDLCQQALDDAGLTIKDIDGVVLVGGSTRVPLIRDKIAEFFGKQPLSDINPDEVVAAGAALQAEGLTRGSSNLLLDVLPLSLGLETMGGIVEKVIHRNTPIPVAKAQEFTTYKDGQTGMQIHIVQGEREMVSQNRSLAKFELKGIPPMVAGAARIRVTFTVDADGLLTVSAREETTGTEQIVEVKPSYGLSDEEIKTMLYASMQHGREDMEQRLFAEAKVEAEGIIMAIDAALKQDGDLLDAAGQQNIATAVKNLQTACASSNRDNINSTRKELEKATESFAELRMNKYVGEALKGKKVGEV